MSLGVQNRGYSAANAHNTRSEGSDHGEATSSSGESPPGWFLQPILPAFQGPRSHSPSGNRSRVRLLPLFPKGSGRYGVGGLAPRARSHPTSPGSQRP